MASDKLDYNHVAKSPMVDVAFLDKAAYWVNLAYIATAGLTLMMSVVVVFLSNQRSALKDAELKKVQVESAERVAAANQRSAEFNERAAASNAAAAKAQSEAASAALAQAQLRKENLQLSIELEREKGLRPGAEERPGLKPGAEEKPPPLLLPAVTVSQNTQARVLTPEQENSLLSAIQPFGDKQVTIIELGDPEAGELARQITLLLEKGQWNVAVSRVGALVPPQQGIICTHGPADAAASAFVAALRSLSLIVYERNEAVEQFQIIVGLKPKP